MDKDIDLEHGFQVDQIEAAAFFDRVSNRFKVKVKSLVEQIGKGKIAFLSGDDFTVLPYVACGGDGVISVVGNIAPAAMKALVVAARKPDLPRALELQVGMAELNRMMFVETNPGPVKAAVALLGKASGELRLPLAPVSEANLAKVRAAMVKFGLKLA